MRRDGLARSLLGLLGAGTALGLVTAVGLDVPAPAAAKPVVARAEAVKAAATSAAAKPRAATDGQPTMVKAVAENAGIAVRWEDSTTADSYLAYAVQHENDPAGAEQCTAPSASCTIPGLTNGTAYYVYVMGIVGGTPSQPAIANGGTVVTPATVPVAPGAPQNVDADAIDHGLQARWDEPAPADQGSGLTGYTAVALEYIDGAAGDPAGEPCDTAVGESSCAITGLIAHHEYVVEVIAHGSAESDPAHSDVVRAGGTPPGAPRSVKVVPGVSQLAVTWQAPASVGDGLDFYTAVAIVGPLPDAARLRARAAEDPNGVCETEGKELTCAIVGLSPDQTYTVGVVAVGPLGEFSPEAPAEGTYKPLRKISIPVLTEFPENAPKLPARSATADRMVPLYAEGFAANTEIKLEIYSQGQPLDGSWTTNQLGVFSANVKIPDQYGGSHRMTIAGMDPTGAIRVLGLDVTLPAVGGAGGLPITGAPVANLVRGGLILLLCGTLLIVVSRRRATTA